MEDSRWPSQPFIKVALKMGFAKYGKTPKSDLIDIRKLEGNIQVKELLYEME